MAILELPEQNGADVGRPLLHVSVTRPGLFPFQEARCPCDKAACGLVVVRDDVPCDVHTGQPVLRQAHHVDNCPSTVRRRGFLRRR